jgi:hypothetical protein
MLYQLGNRIPELRGQQHYIGPDANTTHYVENLQRYLDTLKPLTV